MSSTEWFYIAIPLGLALCYATYRLSRRFLWIGFFSVTIFIVVVGWFPIVFLTKALGGSWELGVHLTRVSILATGCGALCAALAKSEENKRRQDDEQEAKRQEYRRYLEQGEEKSA